MQKIGLIGAGAMAEAMIAGMIKTNEFTSDTISVSDINEERLELLAEKYGVMTYRDNRKLVEHNDIIVIAVKPQIVKDVFSELENCFTLNKFVISIVAGVSIATLYGYIPQEVAIARVMPNTPCLIRKGVSAVAFSENVRQEQEKVTLKILESMGKAHILSEKLMDAVTGLSGSGPAYIFLMIEAMSDAGVRVGLPRSVSLDLAVQTVIGAATMLDETQIHPAILKEKVTSPAGTTIAGLHTLEKAGFRAALMDAIMAAAERSAELGSN